MAVLVNDRVEECVEWLARCMTRLIALHPHYSVEGAGALAMSIWADERWRHLEPEAAAEILFPNAAIRAATPRLPVPPALMPPMLRQEGQASAPGARQ
jgi:hypothetical protein